MSSLLSSSLLPAAAVQAAPAVVAVLRANTVSSFSILYASHARWPLPLTPSSTSPPLTISVLDSSFNPAHLAHLAIANHLPSSAHGPPAHLLLLSSKNVDKEPKAGEASPGQRLEMMRVVAREMERLGRSEEGAARGAANVAVGVIEDEPTFVGKSRVLNRELAELVLQHCAGVRAPVVRLCFSQGYDTLIRFFEPKYYHPPAPSLSTALSSFFTTDHSSIACARRGDISRAEEEAFLNRDDVRPWRSRIEMFDLPEEVAGISSTGVRKCVKEGEEWERLVLKGAREIIRRDGLYR